LLVRGCLVKPLWILRLGHSLWSFRDCWTLCFWTS
jgi:hypothetical protein